MKKRSIFVLIVLALLIGTQAFAAPITLWHWWSAADGNIPAFNAVLAQMAKDHPEWNVEVTAQDANSYDAKIKVALASGTAPDIMIMQGLGRMKPFVDSGKIQSLDALITKNKTKDSLVGGVLANFTFGGKVYALPTSMAIGVLYCNKEIFAANNLKLPATFDDLIADSKALSAKGITPIIVGAKDKWPAMFYYDIMAIRSAGVQTSIDALNKKASFNQKGFIDAAKRMQDLLAAGAFNDSMFATSWDEATNAFITGKAAMVFNGSWVAGACESDASTVKGKIVALNWPVIAGGSGKATEFFGGANDSFMLNAGTKDQDTAYKVMSYISSNMALQSYLTGSGLPAWKIPAVDTSKINPLTVQQANLIKNATGFCMWWDTFLGGAPADVHKDLVLQVLAKKMTPEQYAAAMQKQVNEASAQ
jgi:raffinose/stachyose/melibiose transport system substrate-binding protein